MTDSELTPITFAVAVNDEELFENNFMASPCLRRPHSHQIIVQKNFPSAAKAYNEALDKSANDLIVFCHQDIFFRESWLAQLRHWLDYLESRDPNWAVLGCAGATHDGQVRGYVYSPGLGVTGARFDRPAPVQTLDEIVLILRKPSGLRFDDGLPHFHLYDLDICLRAAKRGMKSYAIPAFSIHNAKQGSVLPDEFYERRQACQEGLGGLLAHSNQFHPYHSIQRQAASEKAAPCLPKAYPPQGSLGGTRRKCAGTLQTN